MAEAEASCFLKKIAVGQSAPLPESGRHFEQPPGFMLSLFTWDKETQANNTFFSAVRCQLLMIMIVQSLVTTLQGRAILWLSVKHDPHDSKAAGNKIQ